MEDTTDFITKIQNVQLSDSHRGSPATILHSDVAKLLRSVTRHEGITTGRATLDESHHHYSRGIEIIMLVLNNNNFSMDNGQHSGKQYSGWIKTGEKLCVHLCEEPWECILLEASPLKPFLYFTCIDDVFGL